jgi:hypothetical protein
VCGLRYVVFFGGAGVAFEMRAMAAARERAKDMSAVFVDARVRPFMDCECGQVLDFMPDASSAVHQPN